MVSNILFDEAVLVVTADDRIGELHIVDAAFELARMCSVDTATKDHGEFIGLSDLAIGIEQPLSQSVEACATVEDEVVAVFDLGEEELMPQSRMLFLRSEEQDELVQPLVDTATNLLWGQGIGKTLQGVGVATMNKGVATLFEADTEFAHLVGQPVVLVEIDTSGEGKVGTDANKHSSEISVVDIKGELLHPAEAELEVITLGFLGANTDHDVGGFSSLDDGDDTVRASPAKVGVDEVIASLMGLF